MTVTPPAALSIKAGGTATLKLTATLNEGFHANSHTPSEDYLIPLSLTWGAGAVEAKKVTYPEPKMEKYSFSDKPLSVVSGAFVLTTLFAAPASAAHGPAVLTGKLKYQACNTNSCFAPKTVDVSVPVQVQ